MARAGRRKIARYGDRFKAAALKLSSQPKVLIKDVAEPLVVHPFMLSLWRKRVGDGMIKAKGAVLDVRTVAELRRLRDQVGNSRHVSIANAPARAARL